MNDTTEISLDGPPVVEFIPGIWYRLLGYGSAAIVGIPGLAMIPVAAFIGLPLVCVALGVCRWVRRERVWVGADGIWMRRLPGMRDEFVSWPRIDELAVPIGALRSPWMRVDGCARVRLPLFVGGVAFSDAVAIHAPDVLDRTCEFIVHTSDPRGRWIEGVWICDAHRKKWCPPCNEKPIDLTA